MLNPQLSCQALIPSVGFIFSEYFRWIWTHWWLPDGILYYLETLGSNLLKQFTLGPSECEQSLKHIHSYTSTPKNNTDFEDMLIPKVKKKKKKGLSGLSYFWQLSLILLSTDLTNSSVSRANNIFDEASPMMWVCRTSQSGETSTPNFYCNTLWKHPYH